MDFRNWALNWFNLQLPTSEPLWTPKEGLGNLIHNGEVEQLPVKVQPFVQLSDQQKRLQLFNSMTINQNIVDANGKVLVQNVPLIVKRKVDSIFYNRARYQNVSNSFKNPIKWYHVGLIHEMECTQNFNCYLGNGQPLNRKTTIVPKGRGPFGSFYDGAVDAIKLDKLDQIQDWSIGNTLYTLEGFNGYGYSLYKGINSPYIWSGSNQYTSGKYVADSVYSKSAVSSQIGIALLLKEIMNRL